MIKSKAQIAYEAYPLNQNLPPWNQISNYRKECWQKVVESLNICNKNNKRKRTSTML